MTPAAELFSALYDEDLSGWTMLHHVTDAGTFPGEAVRLGDLEAVDRYVDRYRHRDAYFRVYPLAEPPAKGRGLEVDTAYATVLAADYDWQSDKHPGAPPEAAVRAAVDACPLPPSAVVETANGLQTYHLLTEPIAPETAKGLLARLSALVGLHNDRSDMASVLRLPGTYNRGTEVRLVKCEPGLTYSWADLDEVLPPLRRPVRIDDALEAATSAEVEAFLDRHTENRHPGALVALVRSVPETVKRQTGARHPSLRLIYWQALREARAGAYPARAAVDEATAEWRKFLKDDEKRPLNEAGELLRWQVARVEALPVAEVDKVAERLAEVFNPQVEDEGGRPYVIVAGRHLNEVADELVEVLVDTNEPPALFGHAEGVSLLEGDKLRPLDPDRLLNEVERRTRPVRYDRRQDLVPATLSHDARKLSLMRLGGKLPPLDGLAVAPFLRPDGTICADPGYDEATRLYLLAGVTVEVPEVPTDADVAAAVALVDEVLCDFPLATAADRAHAFSALLTPAVRHLVPLAPLHYINGNTAGVGKNLLAEVLLGIHLGYRMETDPLPADEDEMRKQITALMAEGRRVVMWDEAHYLIGRQLARLLTSARWSDRVLGANVTINAENLLCCYALGNNGEIVGDLRRRVVKVDLVTDLEQPSRRGGFRHPDLRAWAEANRAELLTAVLTLLRAWHCAERPGVDAALGSFERWADIIGGTLTVAGVEGFLDNTAEVLEEGDSRDAEMAGHLADLADLFPFGREFTVAEVLGVLRRSPEVYLLPGGVRPDANDAADRLGKLYRQYRRRPMPGGFKLEQAGTTRGRTRWRVAVRDEVGMGGDGDPSADGPSPVSGVTTPTNDPKRLTRRIVIPTHPPLSPTPSADELFGERTPPDPEPITTGRPLDVHALDLELFGTSGEGEQ